MDRPSEKGEAFIIIYGYECDSATLPIRPHFPVLERKCLGGP